MVDPPAAVREPKQARPRESWERALQVGRELIEEGGPSALTITEVCRRSDISPPSLYARVDGNAGLFAVVHDRGMAEVQATEDRLFTGLPRRGASIARQATDAAAAVARVFETRARFLRPVTSSAESDPALLTRGSTGSRRLLTRVASAMDVDARVGEEIALTLYAECVLRTIYGSTVFSPAPESDVDFRARLARTAVARATGTSPPDVERAAADG